MTQPRPLLLATCFSLLALSPPAWAGSLDGRNAIVLCRESVDGQPSSAGCTMDAPVVALLRAEGATLVSADQADRVRKQLAPAQWEDPAGLKGVNLLDAEIAAVVQTDAAAQGGRGQFKSYQVTASIRLVSTSSARILSEEKLEGPGTGLNAMAAMQDARKRFLAGPWNAAQERMKTALAAPATCDAWVFDVPDLAAVNTVETLLGGLAPVASARRTAFTAGTARWRITLKSGRDAAALASALEGTESPLSVQGVLGDAVQATWKPLARVKLSAVVTELPKSAPPAWFRPAATDLVEDALRATGWMRVGNSADDKGAMQVGVHVANVKGAYAVRVAATRAGKAVATGTANGPEAELPALVTRASADMLKAFRAYLEKAPADLRDIRDAAAAPVALAPTVKLDDARGLLWAAQSARYARDGVGVVRLNGVFQSVQVRTRVGATTWQSAPLLERGEQVRLPAPATSSELLALSRPLAAPLEVEVTARAGERLHRVTVQVPVMLYPVQAMRWAEPASFAAFVNPGAEWARGLALSLPSDTAGEPTVALARLARTWDALRRRHLRYVPDARAPFGAADLDTVELPTATLGAGGGDCDDLTALLATAAEGGGTATRIIRLPGHVMPAVDSGLPFSAWPLLASAPAEVLDVDGRLFLPVESTAVNATFWDAVRQGGARLARDRRSMALLDLHESWKTQPALEQPGTVTFPAEGAVAPTRAIVASLAGAGTDEQRAALQGRLAAALGTVPGMESLSDADFKRLLEVRTVQQAVGCDAPECLSDVGRALAVRLVVHGTVVQVPDGWSAELALVDVAASRRVASGTVRGRTADDLGAAAGPVLATMVADARKGDVASPTVGSRWADAEAAQEKAAGKDPVRLARLRALQGRLDDAEKAAAGVKDRAVAALLRGNIALLKGDVAAAEKHLVQAGDDGRFNASVGGCLVGKDGARCTSLASAVPPASNTTVASGGTDEASLARDALARAARGEPAGDVTPASVRWLLRW